MYAENVDDAVVYGMASVLAADRTMLQSLDLLCEKHQKNLVAISSTLNLKTA